MLKVFLGFVMSGVVLLSSAYVVSPTYATSANVLITQIQAGAIGVATQEFIVIYNNSPEEIDISGWCLTNKNDVVITCFAAPIIGQEIYLPPYAHATAVSSVLAITLPTAMVTSAYVPVSQSSGSMTGSSDVISLVDHVGHVVDRQSWVTPLSAGMQFERHGTGTPVVYEDTDTSTDWSVTLPGILPLDETYIDTTVVDVCPNIEGIQANMPLGKELDMAGECTDRNFPHITITELLPNAAGSDDGHEFIEFFNPNDTFIDLADYQFYVGVNNEDAYDFPAGAVIPPSGYLSVSNNDIPFTLPNSSGQATVALRDGTIVSQTPVYTNPKDGQSWADINETWAYTNHPTPGLANMVSADLPHTGIIDIPTLQSCAENQYRSPDTNRCRLISSTTTMIVTPCKDGQYRSEETNRCRNIVSDAKTVTPCAADEERNLDTNRCRKIVTAATPTACKEGQERNPDTNRCRTITKMPNADYGVLGAETKSGGNWYVFAAVGGVLLLALGYAIWEWHTELSKFFRKLLVRIRRFARMDK